MTKRRGKVPVMIDLAALDAALARYKDLRHLRLRPRGTVVTLESGPEEDPYPHARLRRLGPHLWQLEMPSHTGRWEKTPVRGPQLAVIQTLIDEFGWTLAPIS